jgi:hypothetical protein
MWLEKKILAPTAAEPNVRMIRTSQRQIARIVENVRKGGPVEYFREEDLNLSRRAITTRSSSVRA